MVGMSGLGAAPIFSRRWVELRGGRPVPPRSQENLVTCLESLGRSLDVPGWDPRVTAAKEAWMGVSVLEVLPGGAV